MGIKLRAQPKFFMLDNNNDPAVGWKIYTYETGTTTPKATFTDNAQTGTNANPTILNARGEADIWWSGAYKVVVKDSNDVTIYTVDNYGAGEDVAISGTYNLLANGSFELDDDGDSLPDDWSITEYDATSTVALDVTDPNHGTTCLKFVSTGLGGGYAQSTLLEVSGSQDLFIGFDVKSSVVDVRNRVEMKWYDKDQALLSTTGVWDESAANPTSWTTFKLIATSHASAKYARMVIYGCHNSDVTSGETRFDNMQVVAVTGTMMLQDSDAIDVTGGTATGLTDLQVSKMRIDSPVSAGTSSVYTAVVGEVAYVTNRLYPVLIHTDCAASPTMNFDGIGAKTIKTVFGSVLTAGQLKADQMALFHYDGTDLLLVNPGILAAETSVSASAGSSQVLIGSVTPSASATAEFTSNIDGTFNDYYVELSDVLPATDNVGFRMRISTDGGSTYKSGAADYKDNIYNGHTGGTSSALINNSFITLDGGTGASNSSTIGGISGWIRFSKPSGSSKYFKISSNLYFYAANTEICFSRGMAMYNAVTAIDAIQFYFSAGNIASGDIRLYGIKKS